MIELERVSKVHKLGPREVHCLREVRFSFKAAIVGG
jgi:hypothetical protein